MLARLDIVGEYLWSISQESKLPVTVVPAKDSHTHIAICSG